MEGRRAESSPACIAASAVEPGFHSLSASSEEGVANTTVPVEAGKNYFYQLTLKNETASTKKLEIGWVIIEPMGNLMINNAKRSTKLQPSRYYPLKESAGTRSVRFTRGG